MAAPRKRVYPRGYVVYHPEISSANKVKLCVSCRNICAYVNVACILYRCLKRMFFFLNLFLKYYKVSDNIKFYTHSSF